MVMCLYTDQSTQAMSQFSNLLNTILETARVQDSAIHIWASDMS